jgi:aerobic-type carbon monoxide dehydrogenase small subunit (CoxS/CutS family)
MAEEKEKRKKESGKTSRTNTATVTAPGGKGTASTATITSPPATAAQTSSATAVPVKLTVNGKAYEILVESNWPLRDVLREKLGLISLKDFCGGYGACGSCTVIMDGRPVLSCMILAIACDGAVIETAEGIADANHPLIEAYIMNWAAQCGYCTPGFLVTAKALLDRNPDPTVDEIKEALSGNLCRCGTYDAHIKAVLEAAEKLREGK